MIGVFYPYWHNGAKWEELRYSLRSLSKYFKEEYTVYLVGDCPDWVTNVIHIPHVKNTNVNLTDSLQKLRVFLDFSDLPDLFLRMYDDVYFLNETTLDDLMVTRIIRKANEIFSMNTGGENWRKNVTDTVQLLLRMGYDGYMTESHCPELFNRNRMLDIFDLFEPQKYNLLVSTLYYNLFPFEKFITDRNMERALFYGRLSDSEYSFSGTNIDKKLVNKRYLNHNNAGLNSELKKVISELFKEKCLFEK